MRVVDAFDTGGTPPGDSRYEFNSFIIGGDRCALRSVSDGEVAGSFVGGDGENDVTTDLWRGDELGEKVIGRT